jgi:D-sedoheptulose 7-phosphate isomerase
MTGPALRQHVELRLREAAQVAAALANEDLVSRVSAAGAALVDCYRDGGKAILLGNGGSAAQASHLAAELVGRYLRDRPALPALSLLDNQSAVTAIGNDYDYESSFSRQVQAHARTGDVVIGLTTSGTSPNVVAALRAAREGGAVTIGMTGRTAGALGEIADHVLLVASDDTPRIQEAHLVIGHTLCEIVERALFPG